MQSEFEADGDLRSSRNLERFANPLELERLAKIARGFNDPRANEISSDSFVLGWALGALACGVSVVLGTSHPLFSKMRVARDSCGEVVDVWRQVCQLPPGVVEEMIIAARNQRNQWALEDGDELDLRE